MHIMLNVRYIIDVHELPWIRRQRSELNLLIPSLNYENRVTPSLTR